MLCAFSFQKSGADPQAAHTHTRRSLSLYVAEHAHGLLHVICVPDDLTYPGVKEWSVIDYARRISQQATHPFLLIAFTISDPAILYVIMWFSCNCNMQMHVSYDHSAYKQQSFLVRRLV